MKINENNKVQVTFINDHDVTKIRSTPNKNILYNSLGQGILNVKFKSQNENGHAIATISEVDIESEKYFKPTSLIEENVEDTKIFSFATPKKQHLIEKLKSHNGNSPSTPKTPKLLHDSPRTPKSIRGLSRTPRSNQESPRTTPKINRTPKMDVSKMTPKSARSKSQPNTPYSFRRKVKQRITDLVCESDDSTEEEYDDSDMDGNYTPTDSGGESDLEISHLNDESPPLAKSFKFNRRISLLSKTPVRTPRRGRERKVDVDMAGSSYDYFLHNSDSKSCLTSDHTLNKLETPRLGPDAIKSLLKEVHFSHKDEKQELMQDYIVQFSHWMVLLCEGFSIFLCGVGSKKQLLSKFQVDFLHDIDHLVINGFFPSLSPRNILLAIVEDILEIKSHPQGIDELMSLIRVHYCQSHCDPLFLIIHNLDGPMLRNDKAQMIISQLSSFVNIHLIASIDHINAPLLFDFKKLSNYNPLWFDATTLATYSEETSYENSLLVQQSGALALSSLIHVFKSLTPNARGIFVLLANYQLDQKNVNNYAGMSFSDLYQKCRENFLVNSDLTLRAQLTEFKDHKLIKTKKSLDGMENLLIPLESSTLQEFISQHEDL